LLSTVQLIKDEILREEGLDCILVKHPIEDYEMKFMIPKYLDLIHKYEMSTTRVKSFDEKKSYFKESLQCMVCKIFAKLNKFKWH